jgi:dTMP kinase
MSGFIAIEGLDGSGKSTQIDLLINYLNTKGIQTKFVHFPRASEGVFGHLISKFLRGEFGSVSDVHPQLVALLFAEDRKEFSTVINDWLANDYFVLVDRYVLSNIAFQCAKLKEEGEKKYLRDWINDFEYEYNKIPKPDFSIYLDVPFEFVTRSLEERRIKKGRAYLNDKDDIHENDYSLQKAVKQEYETLCKLDDTIHKINCFDSAHQMRAIESIQREIIEMINVKIR